MMKIPEKKIETYSNPEHSDRDIRKQLKELEDKVYDSLGIQKEDHSNIDFKEMLEKAMETLGTKPKRVIGKYMGKDVCEGDIKFDPEKNVYVIDLGDGSVAEVDPKHFSYAMNSGKSFDDWYEEYHKEYIDTGVKVSRMGASFDSQGKASVRMRGKSSAYDSSEAYGKSALDKRFEQPWKLDGLGQRITGTKAFGGSAKLTGGWGGLADYKKPWDDPLKDMQNKADNTVACMDMPEWRPDYNPNEKVKVYYHDRFPSIPVREIVNDAILMLRAKKQLNISIHSFSKEGDDYRLIYKVIIDNVAPDLKQGKLIECILTKKAFDRMSSEIDKYAKLKAKLDTNTFLKLRIAFLLYEAQKLGSRDAKRINLDIFRIIGSSSHPILNY